MELLLQPVRRTSEGVKESVDPHIPLKDRQYQKLLVSPIRVRLMLDQQNLINRKHS